VCGRILWWTVAVFAVGLATPAPVADCPLRLQLEVLERDLASTDSIGLVGIAFDGMMAVQMA